MSSERQTLGALLRGLRSRNNWTLKEMSDESGIPVSTLSKVEHDRLTLSYDKLQQTATLLSLAKVCQVTMMGLQRLCTPLYAQDLV